MALFMESGKVIGQILTVIKYAARVRNDTFRFRPSPRKIKVLVMKPLGVVLNQTKSLFEGLRDPVKVLSVPVVTKDMITKTIEEFEIKLFGDPEIYGEQVAVEDLFDYWIYYAQDKSHKSTVGTVVKPIKASIPKPLPPKKSRLEEIKQRIRNDILRRDPSNPSKL